MGLSGKIFASQKCRGEGVFKQKTPFLPIFRGPLEKFSTGSHSDNFYPRTSAYGSFESLCPKFFKTHVKKVSISKIVGASPLQSQLIQNREPKKWAFFRHFLRENALSRPNRPFLTP